MLESSDRIQDDLTANSWGNNDGAARPVHRPDLPGSTVILGPNSEEVGKMRLWLWEFAVWAGRKWNLIQDAYSWAVHMLPLGGIMRLLWLVRFLCNALETVFERGKCRCGFLGQ